MRIILLLIALISVPSSFAQTNWISVMGERQPVDDVDQILTTDSMRASGGSKSRYSLRSNFKYDGSTLQKPLSPLRPNLSGTTGTTDTAVFGGEIGGQFNYRPVHSFLLGVGLRWIAPFEHKPPSDYEGSRLDVSNPYLTYQHVYSWHGLESILQLRLTHFTNSDLVRRGYAQSLTLSQESNFQLGQSRWYAGFYFWSQVSRYAKKGPLGTPADSFYMPDVRTDQSDYGLGFNPSLRYELSDRFSLSTSFTIWEFEHLRSFAHNDVYETNKMTQTLSVGMSLTRDIYVSGNLAFLPEDIRADRTNVGVSADVNLF